jgi:hypothetical protein
MLFSMKRSLVVFVALGLLAGLVGCGGSSSDEPTAEDMRLEREARTWVKEYLIADLGLEEAWNMAIESISYEDYIDACVLDTMKATSEFGNDVDYWREAKKNSLDPNFEPEDDRQERFQLAQSECSAEVLTPQEYSLIYDATTEDS